MPLSFQRFREALHTAFEEPLTADKLAPLWSGITSWVSKGFHGAVLSLRCPRDRTNYWFSVVQTPLRRLICHLKSLCSCYHLLIFPKDMSGGYWWAQWTKRVKTAKSVEARLWTLFKASQLSVAAGRSGHFWGWMKRKLNFLVRLPRGLDKYYVYHSYILRNLLCHCTSFISPNSKRMTLRN